MFLLQPGIWAGSLSSRPVYLGGLILVIASLIWTVVGDGLGPSTSHRDPEEVLLQKVRGRAEPGPCSQPEATWRLKLSQVL